MNYVAQQKLFKRLLKNPKIYEFLKFWQTEMMCKPNKQEFVRVGWLPISDYVIRNLKL